MSENEKFLAALTGLRRIVDDRSRSRADRLKARGALDALLSTAGGSVLRLYSGGQRETTGAEHRVEAEYDGWGEYR